MAFPLLETPKYQIQLLSGTNITYRPFLVKEQKILLTALNTGERKDALGAMMDVINACTFNQVDAHSLPTFEVERLFLNIRAKSVGEELPVNVKCDKCDEPNPYTVHLLEDMKVLNYRKPEPVALTDNYGLVFDWPTAKQMQAVSTIATEDQLTFYLQLAKACLKGVYQDKDFYTTADATPEELSAVFDRLEPKHYEKIQAFFDSPPSVSYLIKFKCKKCQHDNELTVEGTDSFFG